MIEERVKGEKRNLSSDNELAREKRRERERMGEGESERGSANTDTAHDGDFETLQILVEQNMFDRNS